MRQIIPHVWVGTNEEAEKLVPSLWRFVNVSKTYHYKLLDWQAGKDYKADPNYVVLYGKDFLSINWVDAKEAKYFDYQGNGLKVVKEVLEFIDSAVKSNQKVIVMCDKGHSRSPSIVFLYMSKIQKLLPEDFEQAMRTYATEYDQEYQPGDGIYNFMQSIWQKL